MLKRGVYTQKKGGLMLARSNQEKKTLINSSCGVTVTIKGVIATIRYLKDI